jgi:hypothetical protein
VDVIGGGWLVGGVLEGKSVLCEVRFLLFFLGIP